MRCPQCGSDNPAEYRFCGMCGTPLEKPAPVAVSAGEHRTEPARRIPPAERPISGPSFLGLGDESPRESQDLSYLFEEEAKPRRTYWRFLLLLLVLAVFGGLGWLQFTRSGKSWVPPWSKAPAEPATQAGQAAPETQNQQAPAQPQPEANSAATPNSAQPGQNSAQPSQAANSENQPPANEASSADKSESSSETDKAEKNEKSASSEKSSGGADAAKEASKPATRVRATKPKPSAEPATSNQDDLLVANAEKYLYGRGVPQNCDRAVSALRSAAQRENARAQNLLGTMYATGHCAPRDLPNAYHWFSLGLRQDPNNVWVQRNLEMLWRQMTPAEKQLATRLNQ